MLPRALGVNVLFLAFARRPFWVGISKCVRRSGRSVCAVGVQQKSGKAWANEAAIGPCCCGKERCFSAAPSKPRAFTNVVWKRLSRGACYRRHCGRLASGCQGLHARTMSDKVGVQRRKEIGSIGDTRSTLRTLSLRCWGAAKTKVRADDTAIRGSMLPRLSATPSKPPCLRAYVFMEACVAMHQLLTTLRMAGERVDLNRNTHGLPRAACEDDDEDKVGVQRRRDREDRTGRGKAEGR